jgi:hypothetical protein
MSAGRFAALASAVLVLAAAALLPMLAAPDTAPPASARGSDSAGRRALFLLLAELGFEPELWGRPPGALPGGSAAERGLLWMPGAPAAFDPQAAPDDPLERSRAAGGGAWAHYRGFVSGGGTLVLVADGASEVFLDRALGLSGAATEPFEASAAPAFEGSFAAGAAGNAVELRGGGGELLARELPLGDGALVLVAGGDWLDNSGLGRAGALFAVRLVERAAERAGTPASRFPVRFDEWALRSRPREGSALALAFGPGRFASLHLALVLALLAWRALGAREFPRDPGTDESFAPILRARARAAYLARLGRHDALADLLRAGRAERAAGPGHRGGADAGWTEGPPSRKVTDLEGLVALDRELEGLERPG